MKKVSENRKVTLTLGQLKRLVSEGRFVKEDITSNVPVVFNVYDREEGEICGTYIIDVKGTKPQKACATIQDAIDEWLGSDYLDTDDQTFDDLDGCLSNVCSENGWEITNISPMKLYY